MLNVPNNYIFPGAILSHLEIPKWLFGSTISVKCKMSIQVGV